MTTTRRRLSRAAAVFLLVLVPVLDGGALVLDGAQTVPAPELDRALRANDLQKARSLVPGNWAAAEQLFMSYLERAFLTPGPNRRQPDARTLAGRLGEVFFRIIEYDFASSLVTTLETADAAKREQLIGVARDYYPALERLRRVLDPATAASWSVSRIMDHRWRLVPEFLAIADRFRALSFRRGELHTLRGMINLPNSTEPLARADALATELGDELSLVRKRPFTEASLALAVRLDLPGALMIIAESMAARTPRTSTDKNALEQAAKYWEQARDAARRRPVLETMSGFSLRVETPRAATFILPRLAEVHHNLNRPDAARAAFMEAFALSRPFGGDVLERTLAAGNWAAVASDAIDHVLESSQSWDAITRLAVLRGLSGSGVSFRVDLGDKALALALTIPDPHQRAVTLAWYSKNRVWLANSPFVIGTNTPESIANRALPIPAAYDQLLQLCLKSDEAALTADALVSQAELHLATGNRTRVAPTFTMAIAQAERTGDNRKVAQVANRAAGVSPTASDRAAFAGRAIDAATKADDPLELSRALRARVATSIGASQRNLEDLLRALAAAERYTRESNDWTEEGECLSLLAREREIRGEYRAAIEVLERLLEGARLFGRNSFVQAGIYAEIARINSTKLGEPAQALAAGDRARQLLESISAGTDRPAAANQAPVSASPTNISGAHTRLAALSRSLGQPTAALNSYERVLSIWTGDENLGVQRSTLANRARYLSELGDYESSLHDWHAVERLLAPTVRMFGNDFAWQRGQWLSEVARVHVLAGDLDQALVRAREAVVELGRQTSDRWAGWNYLSPIVNILLETNHADEALAFSTTYFAKFLARPSAQPVLERAALEVAARIHLRMGRTGEARSLLLAAARIDREHPTAEVGGLSSSLLALGRLETLAGNFTTATQRLSEARTAVDSYNTEQIWQIEQAQGRALAGAGHPANAEAHFERAVTALESVRERLRPEEFRLKYGFDRSVVYDEYAGLLAARAARSGAQADAEQAFQAAERKRMQTLWGLLATGWSRLPRDAQPEQLRRALDLEARIAAKQTLLREQSATPLEQRDAAMIEDLQSDLIQIQAEHAGLLTGIAQGQHRFAAPTDLSAALAAPVRAALGSSRALVEYLVLDDRSFAFVVSHAGIKVVPLVVGRKQLRAQVERLLQPFRQLRTGQVDLARLTYDTRAAHDLYQATFAPVESALGSTFDILIVPDDVLNVLPFEALVERLRPRLARTTLLHGGFADEAFLIRRYSIGYLTSSAQLLSGAGDAPRMSTEPRLFAMANATAGRAAPAAAQDDPLKRQLRSAMFDNLFMPLPGSEIEVARIAGYFGKDATTIFIRDKATEAAYRSQAGEHSVVHFATHAVASDGQPLYSTLLLAPDSGGGSDGFLQAYEVLRTPLKADLVVLSACETALGGEDWGQGLVGLVAAFEQAGARSVLATLWSIDESAIEVMGTFYREMSQGASTPAALRQAKLELLRQRTRMGNVDVSLAHPFFWAAFKLVGVPPSR